MNVGLLDILRQLFQSPGPSIAQQGLGGDTWIKDPMMYNAMQQGAFAGAPALHGLGQGSGRQADQDFRNVLRQGMPPDQPVGLLPFLQNQGPMLLNTLGPRYSPLMSLLGMMGPGYGGSQQNTYREMLQQLPQRGQ